MMYSRYYFFIFSSLLFVGGALTTDENTCHGPDWFLCTNERCLSTFFVCDGEDDCLDNSDELDCPDDSTAPRNVTCAADEFKCKDNLCIPLDDFCDQRHDCPDGSDEYIGCTHDKTCNGFRCKNGYCVKNEWICDGVDDCSDLSDELDCANHFRVQSDACNNEISRFLCNNSRCIYLNKACDGVNDCGDYSDENETECKNAETACVTGNGCSSICNKTPKGPVCSCHDGYRLTNNRSCTDINECIENSELCDQRCINTAGSYYCICEVDYELQDDKKTCKATAGEALMVISTKTEIRGLYLQSEIYFPITKNLQHVLGVSLDANFIYWSDIDIGNEAIVRSKDDGTNPEVIVTAGIGLPEDIALDWVTGNIYFTDSVWKHIGVCKTDGSYCTVIINETVDMPRGLALYPINGQMFWSDFGAKPHISMAGMDGKNRKALVTENLIWPNGLAIDYPAKRLYWVDAKHEIIESIRLDGTDRREVLRTTATHPYSIAIFESKLYWSDWETKSIQSCNKYSGKNRTTVVREIDMIYGIHIYHSALKPKIPNPCNTNPCSQLCLLAMNRTYSCACTLDKELSTDKHTCRSIKKQEHLVVASGNNLIDYYHELLGKPKVTGSSMLQKITHVAYDSITGTIIGVDQKTNDIFRYNPNTYEVKHLINVTNEYIGGLDFDYYGNNLYWSDTHHRTIEIHSLETGYNTVLHFTEEPWNILLVPEHGIMYVVFKSKEMYHLDKLQMNGSGTKNHIEEQLHGPKVSLAYDKEMDRIFWADEGTGRIESVNLEGEKRKLFRSGLQRPMSLALLGRDIFWTLRDSNRLQWADKQDRVSGSKGVTLRVHQNNSGIMDLTTMRGVYAGRQHKCQINNGGCSHVCLVSTSQFQICACPTGMILNSEKRTCSLQVNCTADEIRCSDNNACINKMRRCNGIQDCPNGEDEDNCDHIKTCDVGEFACRNGQCINVKDRCNSVFDCVDETDEANCDKDNCKQDEFQCLDGQCITKFFVCDGRNDCADFSDESNCGRHICDEGSFRCTSGTCIPKSWECDGQNDCIDSSDEGSEKCKVSNCPADMFRCTNKRCLDLALMCNKIDDCGDNSDEDNCNQRNAVLGRGCTTNEYRCHGTEKCISLKLRCNGQQDCPKNDDEHNCAQCDKTEFACENKKCIPQKWVCDHWDDCGDKSDERICSTKNNANVGTTMAKKSNHSADCKEFACAIGTCLPYENVCDGKRDCFDGSDEDGLCPSSCTSNDPCEQLCQKTPSGPLCSCQEGLRLRNDGTSCEDIDECQQGICPQICQNTHGSYSCSCFDGYALRANKISCKVTGKPMEIITATKADIRRISATLSSIQIVHKQPNVDVTGLDINTKQDTLYWSNELLGTINRLNMKTKEFKLVSGLGRPRVLAVDWITDNVYFHDSENPSSIKVCAIDEQKCASVVKIEGSAKLISIAIDPTNGWLFWSQTTFEIFADPIGEIYRTDMSGSNQMNIAHEKLGVVSGITIDHKRLHLYWVDAVLQVVERSNLNGENREILLQEQVYQPLGINVYEDSIYWLMGSSGILKKCELNGDKACESIPVKTTNVNELFVISQDSRQPTVKNECESHQCDHMCVLRNNKFACICPNGDPTNPNTTCSKETTAMNPVKFETITLGLNKENVRSEGGLFTGIVITVAMGIAILSAYYYYQKKKFDFRNKRDLSIHFQNPSFGRRSVTGLTSDFVVPVIPPGEHEYTNPITEVVQCNKIQKQRNAYRKPLELIQSDQSESELDDVPQNIRLLT